MITAILLTLFIVGISYRNATDPQKANLPFFRRNSNILILLGITLIPVLYINTFHPSGRRISGAEYFEYVLEKGSTYEKIDAYEYAMHQYPDSTTLRFDFIDMVVNEHLYTGDSLHTRLYSSNPVVQQQSISYLSIKYQWYSPSLSTTIENIPETEDRYQHYLLGMRSMRNYEYQEAKNHFLKEIQSNPNFDNSYSLLIGLCKFHIPSEFKKYALDPVYASHLPFAVQRYNYFIYGEVYNYLKVITFRSFHDIELLAFIASLLIAIVWMIFLRSMDVYNKEKWRDILIVFLLGSAFTNLCYIGYDYFHYVQDFVRDGTAFNDFWYCVIVIGGSEETVKLIPWVLFILLTRKAKEPFDYLLYASVSALGFAFVENWMYLENPGNIVVRSIMSTIGHMFFASVIAYAMILARYKAKRMVWKILLPILGFAAAMLSHGFYDYWLISPPFPGMQLVTVVFFILTLHIWFFLHNNAINNSPFYTRSVFNSEVQLNILTIGIVGLMSTEYLITGYHYGSDAANSSISSNGWIVVVFLSYMTAILGRLTIIKGKWKKYRFSLPKGLGSFFTFNPPPIYGTTDEAPSFSGLQLRLYVQKSNRYIADKFPKSGVCEQMIQLSNSEGWYMFRFNKPLEYSGFEKDKVVIRVKSPGQRLDEDKVEIIMLLIPIGMQVETGMLRVEDLRFTGRAFARPV